MKRRDLLKGLATVPVLGAFTWAWFKKQHYDNYLKSNILEEIKLKATAPEIPLSGPMDKQIRLGLIGYGIRGKHLARAAGFAHPGLIDNWIDSASDNHSDNRYRQYLEQEDLNVVLNGVCDIFDTYGRMAR
ncbi:MAG: gfo/Idh/MocA family oxidoreductase, partial [Bacteroidetes bacterium]